MRWIYLLSETFVTIHVKYWGFNSEIIGRPTCIIDVTLTDSDGGGEREIMSNWFRFTGSNSSLPPPSSQTPAVSQSQYQGNPSVNFTAKREAERAAVQDSHIHHLRQQIENRLKVRTENMRLPVCKTAQQLAKNQTYTSRTAEDFLLEQSSA